MSGTKVDAGEAQEMLDLWNDGYNVKEIGAIHKRCTATISKHLQVQGVSAGEIRERFRHRNWAPDVDAALVRYYVDEHLSLRQVADIMGLSNNSVRYRLRVLGVELRPAGPNYVRWESVRGGST